ncbi:hypothetical protein AAFF_G00376590 [Aldrovandia affinis]|uniref:Uncharacterized protein n=1 Tax=Aldrovandia affinis TaxID=143900 RepID=A0AAD7SG10_9TELE|nr:hypothetical protein AAFF_G00376590 [Aldrovandia affinis]
MAGKESPQNVSLCESTRTRRRNTPQILYRQSVHSQTTWTRPQHRALPLEPSLRLSEVTRSNVLRLVSSAERHCLRAEPRVNGGVDRAALHVRSQDGSLQQPPRARRRGVHSFPIVPLAGAIAVARNSLRPITKPL